MGAEYDPACGRWIGRSEPLILGKYTQAEADAILDGPDSLEKRQLQGEIIEDILARPGLEDAELANCALYEARIDIIPLARAFEDLERQAAQRRLPEYNV